MTYERGSKGGKVDFELDGRSLGTSWHHRGDYITNAYYSIPEGATQRDDLRGMSKDDLHAAGWRFIS